MSVIGLWRVTLSTPVGPQTIQLRIDSLGPPFTGRIDGPMGRDDIRGSISGDTLSWVMDCCCSQPIDHQELNLLAAD